MSTMVNSLLSPPFPYEYERSLGASDSVLNSVAFRMTVVRAASEKFPFDAAIKWSLVIDAGLALSWFSCYIEVVAVCGTLASMATALEILKRARSETMNSIANMVFC